MKNNIFKIQRPPYSSSMMELRNGKRYPKVMTRQEHDHAVAEEPEHVESETGSSSQINSSFKK